eukprot:CAMPEP_0204454368 /NCGR_PEP_ID=MMETSP0470-20130426/102324_1 /ASSEMBLY_ACC=CAM_ASM_000385 /TAXON_ID=2969 /ORGANISM="Oxyrrhis marina" /LENGTH=58 /DNA_ID=CAMNT_0051454227 /DNA_START=791 /DNA_END=964 /DNA_ORIENTATION=-
MLVTAEGCIQNWWGLNCVPNASGTHSTGDPSSSSMSPPSTKQRSDVTGTARRILSRSW